MLNRRGCGEPFLGTATAGIHAEQNWEWSFRQDSDSNRFSSSRRVRRPALPFRQTQSLVRLQDASPRLKRQASTNHRRKLLSGDGQLAGVIDNHISQPAFLGQRPLAPFAPIQFVFRPSTMLQHSGQPDRSGTVNQYHPAT